MIDKRLDRIEEQLIKMNDHMSDYNTELKIHIEGVVQNRKRLAKMEKEVDYVTGHVHEVQGGIKLIKILGSVLGLIGATLGILKIIGTI